MAAVTPVTSLVPGPPLSTHPPKSPSSKSSKKTSEESKPSLAESAGEDPEALYQKIGGPLDEIARIVMDHGRPVHRNPSPSDASPFAAVAVPLPGEREAVGVLTVVRPGGSTGFQESEADALSTLAALAAVSLHNAELRDTQRNFFSHVTDMLATALDAHLGFNTGHGQRVAQLANQVGRTLELADDRLHRLHFASLLHDIGMLRLDRNQQMNPRTCEKHCTLGFRMLNRIRLWKDMAPVVHTHHEWWDGSGYPEGLSGDAIPLEARIIALCDAYDSITSDASYRSTLSRADAVGEIQRCKGTQFDPIVVEAFVKLFEDGALPE